MRHRVAGYGAIANNESAIVHRGGRGVATTSKVAEIDHPRGRRPRKGMERNLIGEVVRAYDLPAVVDGADVNEGTTQIAEIDHSPGRRPQKRMPRDVIGEVARA